MQIASDVMLQVQHLHLDARPSGHADEAGILLPAVACLEAVARNMELILNWFSNNSEQKIQTTSLQLEQLLSSGKFHVKLPASVCQQPSLSCTYTLAETSQNREQHMSSDGLTEFVSKLYLNRHQEHNPAVFDERIDLFLGCYKVHAISAQKAAHAFTCATQVELACTGAGPPCHISSHAASCLPDVTCILSVSAQGSGQARMLHALFKTRYSYDTAQFDKSCLHHLHIESKCALQVLLAVLYRL